MGPTGLCTWDVCWKSMPDFPVIAERLHKKISSAKLLPAHNGNNIADMIHEVKNKCQINALCYNAISPEFCVEDTSIGFLGNINRQCSIRKSKDKSPKTEKDSRRKRRRGKKEKKRKKGKRKDKNKRKKKNHRNKEFDLPRVSYNHKIPCLRIREKNNHEK